MHIKIVTPDQQVFEGEVVSAKFPGSRANGAFEVLNNHAAVISNLEAGEVKLKLTDGSEKKIMIDGGVVEVLNNQIIVLAEAVV